jgi:hypothetical protein
MAISFSTSGLKGRGEPLKIKWRSRRGGLPSTSDQKILKIQLMLLDLQWFVLGVSRRLQTPKHNWWDVSELCVATMGPSERERCARNSEEVIGSWSRSRFQPLSPSIIFFQHLFQLRTQFFSSSNINSERPQNKAILISHALALWIKET